MSYARNLLPLLFEKFVEAGSYKLYLLVFQKHCDEVGYIPASIQVIKIERELGGAKRALWEMVTVPRLVKQHGIDIVYTPYQLAPKLSGVKTVSMIRNMEPFLFRKYKYDAKNNLRNIVLRNRSAKTLRSSDRVIAVSEFAKNQCTSGFGIEARKIIKIYHGRDERFSPEVDVDDSAVLESFGIRSDYLFTCGSILPYRRVEYIIKAFGEWQDSNKIMLVIAGTGNDRNYANLLGRLISESPVGKQILMTGYVSPQVMRVLYRSCKLFITTTEIEACPNMGIEALSSGCHILSSDNQPMPEIFQSAASYFSTLDMGLLSKALPKALEEASGVNQKALKRAADFSWKRCADQTFEALTNWES